MFFPPDLEACRDSPSFVALLQVYMFGGLASTSRCSSATVGSSALGDTPGGAAIEDCVGGDSFR